MTDTMKRPKQHLSQKRQKAMSQTYDDVPYDSRPISVANVNRIAAIAHLFGMTPTSPAKCRVLELGCASGGNLLPMALAFPESQFVGFDLSKVQIEEGIKIATAVGTPNIELRVQNIFDIDESIGEFDYIITHGVYSWVPQVVRDKILQVCARHLTPNGVAYVSYNTKPGWGAKSAIREMMQHHARRFNSPREQVQQARMLVDFLAQTASPADGHFAKAVQAEAKILQNSGDAYIYHEHLSPINDSFFFHDFLAHAQTNNLRYLADMHFQTSTTSLLPTKVMDILRRMCPTETEFEQYSDFVFGRTFRCSLLTRTDAQFSGTLQRAALKQLHFYTAAQEEAAPDATIQTDEKTFVTPSGSRVSSTNKLTQTSLRLLRDAAPRTIRFDELLRQSNAILGRSGVAANPHAAAEEKDLLAGMMLALTSNVAQAFFVAPSVGKRRSANNPHTSALVRYQARINQPQQPTQMETRWVSNALHGWVGIDDVSSFLLPLLDGTRSEAKLKQSLADLMRNGTLPYLEDGKLLTDQKKIDSIAAQTVELKLTEYEGQALLED